MKKNILSGTFFNFETKDIFYPNTTTLLMHTSNTVQSFAVVVLDFFLKNLVLAFNLVYLFSAVGCSYFAYRFFLLLTKNKIIIIFLVMYAITLSLAFGPHLHFWGYNTQIPMPHLIIGKLLPQFNNLRVSMRWLIPATIFSAGIFGFILAYIFALTTKLKRIILFSIIYLVLVVEVGGYPFFKTLHINLN